LSRAVEVLEPGVGVAGLDRYAVAELGQLNAVQGVEEPAEVVSSTGGRPRGVSLHQDVLRAEVGMGEDALGGVGDSHHQAVDHEGVVVEAAAELAQLGDDRRRAIAPVTTPTSVPMTMLDSAAAVRRTASRVAGSMPVSSPPRAGASRPKATAAGGRPRGTPRRAPR
jgi:hypothetical protein